MVTLQALTRQLMWLVRRAETGDLMTYAEAQLAARMWAVAYLALRAKRKEA